MWAITQTVIVVKIASRDKRVSRIYFHSKKMGVRRPHRMLSAAVTPRVLARAHVDYLDAK